MVVTRENKLTDFQREEKANEKPNSEIKQKPGQ